MGEDKIFVDTNMLVYAHDLSAGRKHETAQKIVLDLWRSRKGVVSTQVLQEFFVTVTGKIPRPLECKVAKEIVSNLLHWEVILNDGTDILKAIEIHSRHHLSFWDSLIIQSAVKGGVSVLLSEDFSDGYTIEGIRIENPFSSD